jgi:hypothetical protein
LQIVYPSTTEEDYIHEFGELNESDESGDDKRSVFL